LKNTWIHRLGLSALLTLAALGLTLPAMAQDRLHEDFQHTYAIAPEGRLTLHNLNGGVRIEAWDQAQIEVKAVKSARDEQSLRETEIQIKASDKALDIDTKYNTQHRRHNSNSSSVSYEIHVPRALTLNIDLVNGAIDIHGAQGEIKAHSVNGGVEARGGYGRLDLSTVNGGVTASPERFEGKLHLSTVNGGVRLALPGVEHLSIKASTVNGGIHDDFDLPVQKARYGGAANLKYESAPVQAWIDLSSVNGGIEIRRR